MAWIILIAAGLLEVGWASALPATDGFTRPWPTIAFLALLAGSMAGLAKASETIPVGTAYVVWVGIGAVGAATVGMDAGRPGHRRADRLPAAHRGRGRRPQGHRFGRALMAGRGEDRPQ